MVKRGHGVRSWHSLTKTGSLSVRMTAGAAVKAHDTQTYRRAIAFNLDVIMREPASMAVLIFP
jgi:hypothetical protein